MKTLNALLTFKHINATAQCIRHIIGSIGIRVEVYRRVSIQIVDRERHIVCIFHIIKGIISAGSMCVKHVALGNRSYGNRKILTKNRIRAEKNKGVELGVCNVLPTSRDCYLCYQTNRPFPYTRLNTNDVTNEIPIRIPAGNTIPHTHSATAQLRPVKVHSLSWSERSIELQRYNRKGSHRVILRERWEGELRKIHLFGGQKCFGKN